MDWKQIKKGSEVELAGVKIAFEREDGTIKRLTLTDANGKVVRVASTMYGNGLEVFTPAPPPVVEKFTVKGEVAGLPIVAQFDERIDAEVKASALSRAGIEVTVEPEQVVDDIPF
jgi:hypothetical protein